MTKIKKIEVQNFKAIAEQTIEFNGSSAIITAGNNAGKTSLLRGLIDRFRSEKPEIIVKDGEQKGFNIIELTDGSRIEWKFTEKSESFAFITKDGIKQTTGVLKSISEKYFGIAFDIDKFLNSTPKEQSKQLQQIVGIDFTEIDQKYKEAYDHRTFCNKNFDNIVKEKLSKPEEKDLRDPAKIKTEISGIETANNAEIEKVKSENAKLRENWKTENEKHLQDIQHFNDLQNEKATVLINFQNEYEDNGLILLKDFFDFEKAQKYINSLPKPEQKKPIVSIPEPEYLEASIIDLSKLKAELEQAKAYFDKYNSELEKYENWIEKGKQARKEKEDAEKAVNDIKTERENVIKSAKLPEGFEFSENGILFNGFPLDSNQISSSQKYIAGLKLGASILGEVKTLHFDASFLDKNSLSEVQKWANENDYQLLIERPNFEGGEIEYKFI